MIIIQRPAINWKDFLDTINGTLNRSAANQLDSENANNWNAISYLCMLSEIWKPGLHTIEAQRKAGSLLQHLFISVLTIGSKSLALELGEETELATKSLKTIRDDYYLILASGNLQQWRTSIINSSTGNESQSLRVFMNKALRLFELEGYNELWSDYYKKDVTDMTHTLKLK